LLFHISPFAIHVFNSGTSDEGRFNVYFPFGGSPPGFRANGNGVRPSPESFGLPFVSRQTFKCRYPFKGPNLPTDEDFYNIGGLGSPQLKTCAFSPKKSRRFFDFFFPVPPSRSVEPFTLPSRILSRPPFLIPSSLFFYRQAVQRTRHPLSRKSFRRRRGDFPPQKISYGHHDQRD